MFSAFPCQTYANNSLILAILSLVGESNKQISTRILPKTHIHVICPPYEILLSETVGQSILERTNYDQTSLLEVLVHETKKYEDEPDDGNLMTFN
ncbi:MAG: hypothetical protein WCE25_01805 [Nitrososphaeraceae archaeon]